MPNKASDVIFIYGAVQVGKTAFRSELLSSLGKGGRKTLTFEFKDFYSGSLQDVVMFTGRLMSQLSGDNITTVIEMPHLVDGIFLASEMSSRGINYTEIVLTANLDEMIRRDKTGVILSYIENGLKVLRSGLHGISVALIPKNNENRNRISIDVSDKSAIEAVQEFMPVYNAA